MGFKCGIVGLPNVGKSTLFNALTRSQTAEAANFPFCTIDPNVGLVTVDDSRLAELLAFYGSKKLQGSINRRESFPAHKSATQKKNALEFFSKNRLLVD